jgi:shikimate dehydrogenase
MTGISASTRLAGVTGWPLGHTLSPAIHNAAYEALGLDWVYLPLPVPDEAGFRRLAAAARSLPFVGFNITMPYKGEALEVCDEVATAARLAGAVNAVHVVDDRLVGYNTDGRGMLEALSSDAGFDPLGKRVALLGAGGAAAGAFIALVLAHVDSIAVVNRSLENAEELVDRMRPHLSTTKAEPLTYSTAEKAVFEADLVINATPVGMKPGDASPLPSEWLHSGQVVLDTVYGSAEPTALVREAAERGAVALDGVGMLVAQAATSIDIWHGDAQMRAPRDVMRRAAIEALASRNATEASD